MQEVYSFIKRKAKEKSIPIETLHVSCNVSRSSMYRIMKGFIKPTPDVEEKLGNVLGLSLGEKQQLSYYIKQIDVDENQQQARNEIFNMIFSTSSKETVEDIEMVLYDKEKYIKNYEQILDRIVNASKLDNFSCDIKVVNCTSPSYTTPISDLIDRISDKKSINIEHLIQFSEEEHEENVATLKSVIPLLKHSNYSVFYESNEKTNNSNSLFYDAIFVRYTDNKNDKYLFLSFMDQNYSDCYVFDDKNFYSLLLKKYGWLKQKYKDPLIKERNIEFNEDYFLRLEENNNIYLLKPNPCYNRIPLSVYQSVMKRASQENYDSLFPFLSKPKGSAKEAESIINMLMHTIEKRIEASYAHKQIDVLTKSGLEQFASTGRLLDHYDFMPALNKDEVKVCLQYIKDRNMDPTDSYQLYIVNNNMNDKLIFEIYSDGAMLIEYLSDNGAIYNGNCYLYQPNLSNIFVDFVETYIT